MIDKRTHYLQRLSLANTLPLVCRENEKCLMRQNRICRDKGHEHKPFTPTYIWEGWLIYSKCTVYQMPLICVSG